MSTNCANLALSIAAALTLAACSSGSATSASPSTTEPATATAAASTTPTATASRYADPAAMRARVEAAGIALRGCGTPAYDVTGSVAMTCSTVAAPTETVVLATFDDPESGVKAAKLMASDPTRHGRVDYRWWVFTNSETTRDKVVAALG